MSSRLTASAPPASEPWPENMPRHIAIIMDGNGRWAKQRRLPRIAGHKKGAETLRTLLTACRDAGIHHLTVYAFSAENWQRPRDEVDSLMQLLSGTIAHELQTLINNRIRLHVIGELDKLPRAVREQVEAAQAQTAGYDDFHLAICLSYGARQELLQATQAIARDVKAGILQPEAITEADIHARLFTHALPEPDLLIRTGGEQRMSNFLLWQAAYTELYFSDVLWPDFSPEHLKEACVAYAARERRYGRTEQ